MQYYEEHFKTIKSIHSIPQKKKTNSKKIQVMIALWVTWNAMDSQIELQQTVEKECQLVMNSWHGILITLKEIWSWARKVRQ